MLARPAAKVTERKNKKAASAPAAAKTKVAKTVKVKAKKTRVLSPEARKRIADAQRKRWAAQKAKA
jgi:hypothetical protein